MIYAAIPAVTALVATRVAPSDVSAVNADVVTAAATTTTTVVNAATAKGAARTSGAAIVAAAASAEALRWNTTVVAAAYHCNRNSREGDSRGHRRCRCGGSYNSRSRRTMRRRNKGNSIRHNSCSTRNIKIRSSSSSKYSDPH